MHEEKLGLMKFYPFLRCYWKLMPAGGRRIGFLQVYGSLEIAMFQ